MKAVQMETERMYVQDSSQSVVGAIYLRLS